MLGHSTDMNQRKAGIVLALVLLTFAAHYRGLSGQFVDWDDTTHITQNLHIRSLSPANLWAMFTVPAAKLYVPMTWLTFALDYQIWGRHAFGYHLTNLLLHVANTVLVFFLVTRLVRVHSRPVAALTAALFGVHPLHVESVAWATERKDVLFAFFYLLGLLAYLRWQDNRSRSAYWCVFGLFILSILSKSAAVTFPLVLLLLDRIRLQRMAFAEKIPFFAAAAVITLATLSAQAFGRGETVAPLQAIPFWARLGLVGYCPLFYVGKFLLPFHLCPIYPTFDEMGWTPVRAAVWVAAFVAVCIAAYATRRSWPVAWPAWLFYLITLLPTIGLLPVGIHVVADRYSYLPILGLSLILSDAVVALADVRPRWRRIVYSLAGAIVMGLASLSAYYDGAWHNTETLFRSVLAQYPNCLPAHINLTVWYNRHNQLEEAIFHGQRAVEIAPAGLIGRKNLAWALIKAGRYREAVAVLQVAVQHGVDDPDVWRALYESFVALGDEKNAAAAHNRLRRF
jgi:tetratricopeptide (TPR) repeat protein